MRANTLTMKKSTEFNIGDLVLYKNNQLIAFNKPAGLAVQHDKTGDKSLFDLAEIYVKHPLNIIHRIDRPATGVVLFAKTKRALTDLNEQFKNRQVTKTYFAVVGERPDAEQAELLHYLRKDARTNKTEVLNEPAPGAVEARLRYRYYDSIENYHLLKVELITGRHHQIRAQLAAIGCPIKGDVKYGFRRGNRDRSIHLHARKLVFRHPVSGETEGIVAPAPDDPVWNAFNISEPYLES